MVPGSIVTCADIDDIDTFEPTFDEHRYDGRPSCYLGRSRNFIIMANNQPSSVLAWDMDRCRVVWFSQHPNRLKVIG